MAKKTKEQKPIDLTHEQPRRHISRRRHEKMLQRRIYLGVGIVLGLVAILIAIGVINEYVIKPNKPVATINGEKISQEAFHRRLRFEQDNLVLQINQYLQFGEQFANGGPNPFLSTIQPLYEQLKSPEQLADTVIDKIVDEKLIHQLATKYDIALTPEEIQAEIERQFGYDREAEKTNATATETITDTNTAPTMTEDDFKARYAEYVDGMSKKNSLNEEEFRNLFATQLLRTKLSETVKLDFNANEEAVKARYIVIKSEPEVPLIKREADALKKITDARARIEKGEDFASVYKEISEDPGSGANGGDLGCFAKGQMVPEFEEAAFSLAKDEMSQPIKTDFGYHLIQVYDTKPDEEKVCARHILIRVDRAPDQEAIDKAETEAIKTLTDIKTRIENGEDFATLAKELSTDTATAEKGGDLDWVFKGEKGDAFDKAAFALTPGTISDPIKLTEGYAIILVEEKDAEHPVKEEELKKRRQKAFDDWMITQTDEADIAKTLIADMIPELPIDLVSTVSNLAPQLQPPSQ